MKVYKLDVMVIDFGDMGGESIKLAIEQARFPNRCASPMVASIEERDIGPWSDDHPLNLSAVWRFEFKRLFANAHNAQKTSD